MTHGLTLTVMFRSLPVIWQNLGLLSRFGIPGLNGNSVLYECCRETSRSIHCIGVHLTPIVKTNMTSSLRWLPLNAPVNKSLRSRSPSEAMLDISDTTPLKDLKKLRAKSTGSTLRSADHQIRRCGMQPVKFKDLECQRSNSTFWAADH